MCPLKIVNFDSFVELNLVSVIKLPVLNFALSSARIFAEEESAFYKKTSSDKLVTLPGIL